MKFRLIFPLLLLATQSALLGQDAGDSMRKGQDALASGLWEMAALHFNDCLTRPKLSPEEKSMAAVRLAEAWIHDGKAAEALELLGQSFVVQSPETQFWKGQALTGLHRFAEAADVFALLMKNPDAPYRVETGFTLANVELALNRPDAALATLSALENPEDEAMEARIRLHKVEVLLDLSRFAEARQTMPTPSDVGPGDRSLATFLEAHLLLKEGKPADAASSFQTLVDEPQGQSLPRYHLAAVGLADSLFAQGNPEEAANGLFKFLQDHPDSPQLEAMFQRLQNAIPEAPARTDPILDRLKQWIPDSDKPDSDLPATGPLATLDCQAVSAWPVAGKTSDLRAYSLFTRAMGLQRITSPDAQAEAARLLTRLRLENPGHVLASRALFEMARRCMSQNNLERAFTLLDTLRETGATPALRGEAAFLEARNAYAKGDKDQAVRLFDEAAKSLTESDAKIARRNAAVIDLAGSSGTTRTILAEAAKDPELAADLELERALAAKTPAEVRTAIEEFLTHHPDHPRVAEARLAAAEAALATASPDLSFARAQLDTLTADPTKTSHVNPARMALVQLRIEDLSKNSAAAIATAKSIMEKHPGEPAEEAAMVLGRVLFQSQSYNDARMVLEGMAAKCADPARAQAALLLAARSAALVWTPQSQQQALILFKQVIELKGPIAPLAKLEQARLLIDMHRLPEAVDFIGKWFNSLPVTDPMHLPAGLLLGEATYAQGGARPESLAEALAVYDKLLVHAEKQPAIFNRLQYQRGLTLEEMNRGREAFIAFYSVLETTGPPAEWKDFESCGFHALALLEKAQRWPAAIACAKKIASFNGPRAKEASDLATQLQVKHMIWED